jgi:hypothetical protein
VGHHRRACRTLSEFSNLYSTTHPVRIAAGSNIVRVLHGGGETRCFDPRRNGLICYPLSEKPNKSRSLSIMTTKSEHPRAPAHHLHNTEAETRQRRHVSGEKAGLKAA